MIDLNELRNRAYATACMHGWHDEEHSDEHWLMMIITEVAEAVQADRKGEATHCDEELADVIIRCLDLAGLRDIYIDAENIKHFERFGYGRMPDWMKNNFDSSFTEFSYLICRELSDLCESLKDKLCSVIENIYLYCKHRGIDIEYFIEQKMRYNETRPYKHGGKKY